MAKYQIQTPSGQVLEIEADNEAAAIEGAEQWHAENAAGGAPEDPEGARRAALDEQVQREMAMPSDEWEAYMREQVKAGNPYRKQPGRFGMLQNQITDPIGLRDEMIGGGEYVAEWIKQLLKADFWKGNTPSGETHARASEAYDKAAELTRAEQRVAREKNTIIPEILGGFLTTGPGQLLKAPSYWQTAKESAKAGGILGAVTGGAQSEGGLEERAWGAGEGGVVGGTLGPLISNVAVPVASRFYGGVKRGIRHANQAIQSAKNPEKAAVQAVADQMVEAGVHPQRVRQAVAPPASRNLQNRGFTEADLADIISRQLAGEPADSVAASYAHLKDPATGGSFTGATARKYFRRYQDRNPTPLNIADIAVELEGPGGAMPILRRARANFGIADDSAVPGKRLYDRQAVQSGRVADIIQQSGKPAAGGQVRQFEDEVRYLTGLAKSEERAAYDQVRKQAKPIDISAPIRAARGVASGRGGEIGEKLQDAVDLFFDPQLVQRQQSPATRLRLTEARERLQQAVDEGADLDTIYKLERKARVAAEQDQFARPLKEVQVGEPTTDINRYLDNREELDQMIERSFQDGKPTRLTGVLTEFRRNLNQAARSNNKALIDADARFHGNRSAEEILKQGQEMTKRLGPKTRETMREFETMTPDQQELFRVAFEQRLADDAVNIRDTGGAANQFGTQAFRDMVDAFYPEAAGAEIHKRGQDLIRKLNREAISTATGGFITGRGNSPTAPWLADMDAQMQTARAAADAATGRWGKLVENLSNRLAKQIGQQAASAQLRIITETDPAKLLPLLNALEQAAKGTANRKALVAKIRALRGELAPGLTGAIGRYAGSNAEGLSGTTQ